MKSWWKKKMGRADPVMPVQSKGDRALQGPESDILEGPQLAFPEEDWVAPTARSVDELWASYQEEEAMLKAKPGDLSAQRRCADALCGWLRIKTDGQTVTIDGPGDRGEFRVLWAAHAPRAAELYSSLLNVDADADLLCNYIESISSVSAAKGIARAAISGDALVFLTNTAKLKEKYPEFNSGLGHIFTCAFYLAAPFPVKSASRAFSAAKESLKVEPSSRRNRYYAGLAALFSGDNLAAREFFEAALADDATAKSQSERDIASVIIREANRGLGACRDLK